MADSIEVVLGRPGLEQAALVRNGQITAVELVDAAIARIERLDAQVNAVVTKRYDEARAEAQRVDLNAPFAGVPLLMKDVGGEVAGVRHTEGSMLLRDYISPEDGEMTKRLRAAGFIIIGKTNTNEFGVMPHAESRVHGAGRNPWDPSRTCGGSSGGAAAAVSMRYVSIAHGNDGGGSIRIPASCCGVFGLKPSRGRSAAASPAYEGALLGVDHVLTRSVTDSAAVLDAVCGADRSAYGAAPPTARPFAQEVSNEPGRLRIGFTTRTPRGEPLHPDAEAAVRDAARLCEQLGHDVREASPAYDGRATRRTFATIYGASIAGTVEHWCGAVGKDPDASDFEPAAWAVAEIGWRATAADLWRALGALNATTRAFDAFFSEHDLWLTPTTAEPPLRIGEMDPTPQDPLAGFRRSGPFVPHTAIANQVGCPAMSVPLYWNAEGLPIGAHFVAPFGGEALLLRLAGQLERARPWADRRPPLALS